jgi:hypothetical protein
MSRPAVGVEKGISAGAQLSALYFCLSMIVSRSGNGLAVT